MQLMLHCNDVQICSIEINIVLTPSKTTRMYTIATYLAPPPYVAIFIGPLGVWI